MIGLLAKSLGGSEQDYPQSTMSDVGLKFMDVDACSSDSELGDLVEPGSNN